jgi:hypothetical protein
MAVLEPTMSESASRVVRAQLVLGEIGTWYAPGTDTRLIAMFDAAQRTLRQEDRDLHDALHAGSAIDGAAYHDVNLGLAYHVFETTLVYFVFKAWARLGATRWEHAYGGGRSADLAFFPSPSEAWLFEAKWWASKRADEIVWADAAKLREAHPDGVRPLIPGSPPPAALSRFLLCFWAGDSEELAVDLGNVEQFCRTRELPLPCCFGALPTHVVKTWGRGTVRGPISTGYFATVIIPVPVIAGIGVASAEPLP